MTPITRKENYLNEIVGWGETAPEKPLTREEFFFAEILGEVIAPSPVTRVEKYLSAIAGQYGGELPEPVTRIERFLAMAAGMDITVPVPITREEIYWSNYTAIVEFEVENVPPLTYKAIEGKLKNYRIYGNTVNGESVGEKTANLFDGEIEQGAVRVNDGAEVGSDYRIRTKKISVKPITTYTISSHLYIRTICLYNDGVFVSTEVDRPMNANHQITLTMPNNANQIQIVFKNSATDTTDNSTLITPDDFEWGMLNSGSTALPYEPYGYRVPVTVSNGTDAQTIPIYLSEQIRKVGDEAEYIDFGEQKQYFADGTSIDITLPALPTLSGTNTLTVGTEVQPSNVYIKYEGER